MKKRDISVYMMNYVDTHYGKQDKGGADEAFVHIVEAFKEDVNRDFATDQDLCFLLQSVHIPNHYAVNGSKEKLFSKLTEVLFAVWAERMAFESLIPTQKSNREDVLVMGERALVVADVKTFRMGRSQLAPNIKDFIKVSSFKKWIDQADNSEHEAVGGLIVFPESHEWAGQSEVYRLCSLSDTPIVMLSFERLALLLKYKQHFDPQRFFELWDYDLLFPEALSGSDNKIRYHETIIAVFADWLPTVWGSPEHEQFSLEQEQFSAFIKESTVNQADIRSKQVDQTNKAIVKAMTEHQVRERLVQLMNEKEMNDLEQQKLNTLRFR